MMITNEQGRVKLVTYLSCVQRLGWGCDEQSLPGALNATYRQLNTQDRTGKVRYHTVLPANHTILASDTMVTWPVGQRLQAGTEDAPVLDRQALLRRFHDSGAGYKYPDLGLLTYLLTYLLSS